MTKEKILSLLKERDLLLDKDYENTNKADEIEKEIIGIIRKNYNDYEVDFIIETLTRFGQAPNLLYDDNGLFAVSGNGYQPVVTGNEKIRGVISVFIEKKQWKKTVREALKHYLK